jgi:hypothetical protein
VTLIGIRVFIADNRSLIIPPTRIKPEKGDTAMSVTDQTATVGVEFVETVRKAAETMLTTAARINNAIRDIERKCPHSDDPVLKSGLFLIRVVAGDLSEMWDELDLAIASNDLLDIGRG